MLCLVAGSARAQSPVTLTIDAKASGIAIPEDFLGLSFESSNLLKQPNGQHLFSSQNQRLIALFRTLGIRSLRIGGGTADNPRYAIPGERDIDDLFAFASAADLKVIYTLRLARGDAERNAAIARYIEQRYGSQLACFEIGNEPDFYRRVYKEIPDYAAYRSMWERMADAVTKTAPEAKFCGPAAGGTTAWARSFAADFGKSRRIAAVVAHDYPGGNGANVNGAIARDLMLSRAWEEHYDQFYNSFATTALAHGLRYWLEETNNFTGGAADATDTFTAALWALDYLHWWAAHEASGVNFHNRRWLLNTTIFPIDPRNDGLESGYDVHPIAYGIKAFALGSHGREVPVTVANPDAVNVTAYAVREPGNLFVTIVNKKDSGDKPHDVIATIVPGAAAAAAFVMALTASDISSKTGITLGGASISGGAWDGKWTPAPLDQSGNCVVKVAGASAVVVRISLK